MMIGNARQHKMHMLLLEWGSHRLSEIKSRGHRISMAHMIDCEKTQQNIQLVAFVKMPVIMNIECMEFGGENGYTLSATISIYWLATENTIKPKTMCTQLAESLVSMLK